MRIQITQQQAIFIGIQSETRNGFILQSNKVSNIYRVLNADKQPIFGTSKMREAETYFNRNAKEELVHI